MENPVVWMGLGFLFNLLVIVVGGVWKLSRMEISLREAIQDSKQEIDERMDRHVRSFGESILAARQQTTDLGFFVRDNFIKKDELKDQLQALNKKLDDLKLS